MVKPKEEKLEDLEITSIGVLHDGPWDKKYWSSSRGKDRYPYPVGYQALRIHNGSRYKMEIHEGAKGPLFMITSADGLSCSGQTPDIVWETFQKKGCTRVKALHGKRLLCKIDGVEFFGFRNPFVQRLLRELVANVNGTAEWSLLSASFCNEASGATNDIRQPDSCAYPDLLPYLEKPQTTGKRSRKNRNVNLKFSESTSKRLRPPELTDYDVLVSNSGQGNESSCQGEDSMAFSGSNDEYDSCMRETVSFSAKDGLPLEIVDCSDHLREEALLPHEEAKLIISENYISTVAFGNFSIDEKPLDRSKYTELQGISSSIPTEDINVGAPVPKGSQGFNLKYLCALDSLDHMQGDTSVYASTAHKECLYNVKDKLPAADMAISEGSVTESHLEEEMGTGTQNASSVGSDFDSVGQEVAKSMMTVLLPQALPLLKETSRKKKEANNQLGSSFCRAESLNEKNGACHVVNVASPAIVLTENPPVKIEEKVQTFSGDFDLVIPSLKQTKSVIPDSFEDDQCEVNMASKLDENSIHHKIHSKGREKTDPHCAEDTSGGNSKWMVNSVEISEGEFTFRKEGAGVGNQISDIPPIIRKYNVPLSESIIYRNFGDDCIPEPSSTIGTSAISEIRQVTAASSPNRTVLFNSETRFEGQPYNLSMQEIAVNPEGLFCDVAPVFSESQEFVCTFKGDDPPNLYDPSVLLAESTQTYVEKELIEQQNLTKSNSSVQKGGTNFCDNKFANDEEVQVGTNMKPCINMELKDNLVDNVELVGRYVHPMPVLSVLLNARENEIHICVLCGLLADKNAILFCYKVTIKEPREQCPSFIGYTSLVMPILGDTNGREITLDRFGLQFTPDGQSLVALSSIKTPYCREQKIPCLCSVCTLACFEENAIKIVQVKLGYLSVVAKLKTVDIVQCILVCEPNYLVAVENCGRLHIWVMNSTWSAPMDDFIMPTHDCVYPHIVELKRIPKCAPLLVGRHDFGGFSLWDISKRVLISRFSVPSISIFEFSPISLFSLQSEDLVSSNPDVEMLIYKIMAATKKWFSEDSENHAFLPLEGESIAVWLLVSTVSDFDAQNNNQMNDCSTNPDQWWRLALLVKNMVILGNALDLRAAAVGSLGGHGIIGTHDGLVYMWELSSGAKLGSLHHFKGGVSCIATDDSRSDVFSVASDGGELLVYVLPQKEVEN